MQHTTVRNLVVTMITSTGSSSSTSRLCWGICEKKNIYGIYILGIYTRALSPLPFHINSVGLQRCFSFSYPCCFPETDNPGLVTCSLNKCTFPNSQTTFYISMQVLLCVLPMSKQPGSFHVFREAAAVSGARREGRCVLVSTLERDMVPSTFLAIAGSKQGGWLSSPFSLCSIQTMWIRGFFINSKYFRELKTASLPDLSMAESLEGNWDAFSLGGALWSL